MVEGTGLENQRGKPPQVRILSFPPKIVPEIACYRGAIFKERARIIILPLATFLTERTKKQDIGSRYRSMRISSFPPKSKNILKKSRRRHFLCYNGCKHKVIKFNGWEEVARDEK